jgi:hypothetical protein
VFASQAKGREFESRHPLQSFLNRWAISLLQKEGGHPSNSRKPA